MNRPKVSVIIPAYNSEKYIGRCLDSILNQSFEDFEVLVINDGSKDCTGEIIQEYEKKDKRIRYFEQKNMGVAKTRDKAIKLAKGDYVSFVDNDDYIERDYLGKLLPTKNEEIIISGYKRPDSNGHIKMKIELKDGFWSRLLVIAPWAKIYRKDFIVNNKINFLDNNIGEDVFFNLIAMLTAKDVKILDYVGYNWFYNEKSVSNTKHKKYRESDIFKLLDSCYDEIKKRKLLEDNYDMISFFFYRFIVWFLLHAAKGEKKIEIERTYDSLFKWLDERFPDYKKNKLLKGNLAGEIKSTRLIYKTFLRFQKIGLGKALVRAYAKI